MQTQIFTSVKALGIRDAKQLKHKYHFCQLSPAAYQMHTDHVNISNCNELCIYEFIDFILFFLVIAVKQTAGLFGHE